jgi:hypothetical protein
METLGKNMKIVSIYNFEAIIWFELDIFYFIFIL